MKHSEFQSGAKVTKQLLTNQVDATTDSISSRIEDIDSAGVLKDLLNEMELTAGDNSTGASPSITVRTGVGYNSLGERIVIPDEAVLYNASNPTTTTADGIGGTTLTPQSTGSKNLGLTANANNFVWIDYLETTDPSVFTLHKITGKKLFYSQLDGYRVGVSSSSSVVPSGFSSAAVLLGLVVTDSTLTNGVASIDQALRPNFGTQFHRVLVQTPQADRSDASITYSAGQTLFLDEHVKAVGSSPVTPTNPHGLSAEDIGITDPGGAEHQKFLHTGGIVSSSIGGNASALFMQEHTSGIASENFVEIFPLTTEELAVVNGVTIDSASVGTSVQFSFVDTNGNPLPDGVHTIYLDSNSRSVERALPGTFNTGDESLQRIWTIQWVNPTLVATSKQDYRLYGTSGPQNMRFELLGGIIGGLATGNRTMTFTYVGDNISQIGIGGDNGTISGSTTLVTFAYNMSDQVVHIGSEYGHRLLTTTITYTGDQVSSITETVI